MNRYYYAFGLRVASDFPLMLPEDQHAEEADVYIRLSSIGVSSREEGLRLRVPYVGRFRIRGGKEILVDLEQGVPRELASLYLLGSCMGAILYQRGGFLLHGSCVAKDGKGILLTGDSGVGKSAMAREFINRGWQLVTDDVAAVQEKDGRIYVQASYPSQKLWQDVLDAYALIGCPLLQQERRKKYAVDASANFREGLTPLQAIVCLRVGEETQVTPINGIDRVDQIMRNMYRSNFIPQEKQESYFQRCVDLADQVPLFLGVRTSEAEGTKRLCSRLEEMWA